MMEPLPCPFCGLTCMLVEHYGVRCGNAECSVQPSCPKTFLESDDSVVGRWNTRCPVNLKPCSVCGCDMGTSDDERCCWLHS